MSYETQVLYSQFLLGFGLAAVALVLVLAVFGVTALITYLCDKKDKKS